jgi:para-nitrobenzyl esterase
MLQTNQELSRYIPVYADINTDADNPAGEDLTLPLGAQHSGTNGLVHFPSAQLDANQAALQNQLLAEWTYFAQTGNPSAPQTPAWALYSGGQHPVMLLQPADTSQTTPAAFIAAQHNCAFWNQATHY